MNATIFAEPEAVVWKCSVENLLLEISQIFTGKHLCQSLFFNKVAGLRLRLWHRCFPVNFAKFLRTPFFTKYLRWLLLQNFIMVCLNHCTDLTLNVCFLFLPSKKLLKVNT